MQKPLYYPLEVLVNFIDEPNRAKCRRILNENYFQFKVARGSSQNHQAWRGGYLDHVAEVMNIMYILYYALSALRPLPFSLSDALLVGFLHDVEKPWKYDFTGANGRVTIRQELRQKKSQHNFRLKFLRKYRITLSEEQKNALEYAEGEHDHSPDVRLAGELAAFSHMADVASARLWHDYPKKKNDPWKHAVRSALRPRTSSLKKATHAEP